MTDRFDLKLGDCLDLLKSVASNSIDLVVTSPPYDDLRSYNNTLEWDFKGIAKELFRTLKPGGVIVWIVADQTINGSESGNSFRQALFFQEIGLRIHDTMVYLKKAPIPLSHNRYEQQFEYMFVFSKGKPKTFNGLREDCKTAGTRNHMTHRKTTEKLDKGTGFGSAVKETRLRYNVWLINNCLTPNTRFGHPAPFPIEIPRDHILSWSNPGEIVLDPFTGSGTTGLAALKTGRTFLGMEKVPKYFAIAFQRLISAAEEERSVA